MRFHIAYFKVFLTIRMLFHSNQYIYKSPWTISWHFALTNLISRFDIVTLHWYILSSMSRTAMESQFQLVNSNTASSLTYIVSYRLSGDDVHFAQTAICSRPDTWSRCYIHKELNVYFPETGCARAQSSCRGCWSYRSCLKILWRIGWGRRWTQTQVSSYIYTEVFI